MDYACILCNHLAEVTQPCPFCGHTKMQNIGLLQDFYDPYSPYLDQEIYQDGYEHYNEHYCVHVLKCEQCGQERISKFHRLTP